MGLDVEDEARCPKSGYSIDMLVREKEGGGHISGGAPSAQGSGGAAMSDAKGWGGRVWAVEFDGPVHFLVCGAPSGATVIKRRHMELLGHSLVSIVFADWYGRGAAEREEYLRQRLSVAQTSSASSTAASSADTTTTTLPSYSPPPSIATASAATTLPPCLPTPCTAASSAATTTTTTPFCFPTKSPSEPNGKEDGKSSTHANKSNVHAGEQCALALGFRFMVEQSSAGASKERSLGFRVEDLIG